MPKSWSIHLYKEYFKFSCAHFLIFPDGSKERLHGHNYHVDVEIEGDLGEDGLVIDFLEAKPVVRELCDSLDEHWIVPGEHPELSHETRADGSIEIRYRERRYVVPQEDVLVLPINNTSAENLSAHVGRELRARLERLEDVVIRRLRVAVEEAPGQRGVYHFTRDEDRPADR